jgi:hypothetical protein
MPMTVCITHTTRRITARGLSTCWLAVLGALGALPTAAQNAVANASTPPIATPAATSTAPATVAATPALTYRSPFDRYKSYGNPPPTTWRAANDNVGRIGGWRTYLREGSETPSTAASAPGAAVPTPATAPAAAPVGTPTKPNPPTHHPQQHQHGAPR